MIILLTEIMSLSVLSSVCHRLGSTKIFTRSRKVFQTQTRFFMKVRSCFNLNFFSVIPMAIIKIQCTML